MSKVMMSMEVLENVNGGADITVDQVVDTLGNIGGKVVDGAKYVGENVADGACWVGGKVADGACWLWNGIKSIF